MGTIETMAREREPRRGRCATAGVARVARGVVTLWLGPGAAWLGGHGGAAAGVLPLDGEWRFALDRRDEGVAAAWQRRDLPERSRLPGIIESQGYGDEIGVDTPWVMWLYDRNWHLRDEYREHTAPGRTRVPFLCQPVRHYLGAAWFRRELEAPADVECRRSRSASQDLDEGN